MIYDVSHTTTFDYTQSVSISQQVLRLKPRSFDGQAVHDWRLDVHPVAGPLNLSEGLMFMNRHLGHHLRQLDRIRRHPNFPPA